MIKDYPVHIQYRIPQLESYFNYMTIGEHFEIYTSILSNNKLAIPITKLNSKKLFLTNIY
jgi:hypothetical protein